MGAILRSQNISDRLILLSDMKRSSQIITVKSSFDPGNVTYDVTAWRQIRSVFMYKWILYIFRDTGRRFCPIVAQLSQQM